MSDLSILQLPAQIVDIKPRVDKSIKISFESRELSGEEAALIFDNFRGEGWLAYKPNTSSEIDVKDIPAVDADAGIESPSKRLRKRIYVLWEQQGKKGSFDNFYLAIMQRFMNEIEERLEDT